MPVTSKSRQKGYEQRERMARRSREQTASISDIGAIPPVRNRRRKESCRLDLHRFLTTYFPRSTGLSPFSSDHLRVIQRIQQCTLSGGRFTNAVYRGFAKTTISENAAIWATAYGHRRFVTIFGSDSPSATVSMDSIKSELSENDLLYEDFPEVCHAVRQLDGRPQRRMSQNYKGALTHMEWSAEQIMLPTIPRSKASGAVICARGITAGFRGLHVKLPDGTQQRPDFIILDDPQTDEVAASDLQVNKILAILRKAIVKLGGHRRQLAIVVNATVIQPDDAIERLLADMAWQGERLPLVRRWPDAHAVWLKEYAELRRTYNRDVVDDQKRAWREATEFYRSRREEMDRGADVSWENCFDPEHEISAVQHAYNALIDDGEESFASEYQLRPLPRIKLLPTELRADDVAGRLNRAERNTLPAGCTRLTAMIDVHQELLYYVVCAWSEAFGGAVVDYGTFPDQGRPYFYLADARPTLKQVTGITSLEGSIYAGLGKLTDDLLGRTLGGLRIERCLIDSGYSAEVVHRFVRQSKHSALLPSKGLGISAAMVPVHDWPKKDGERRGDDWVIRPTGAGYGRTVLFDANRWKSFTAQRLSQPIGESGALLLFGNSAEAHRMFADHCCSEYREKTFGRGREVESWMRRPNGPENHWWDGIVGCAVGASILGLQPSGLPKPSVKARARVSFREMQEKARRGA